MRIQNRYKTLNSARKKKLAIPHPKTRKQTAALFCIAFGDFRVDKNILTTLLQWGMSKVMGEWQNWD